ncbi:hypothetical protein TTHERM_00390020 (macronuclear) [Tetrahymena thermophila SB210]|uniref:Uncharacterized protein n=1 Tax=Tetrahymena thermophila (strain SB210) TaxID=312017 RepID=Q23R86_TETTS|nr:hypothetical protein TTHERM_00390020 [Tetrahymena thermophila SB210]EAR99162.1 hypothetical protein TTHERM_00390020 [Tetrahymena thermophila SB210]|eukprot:XP_001019407.1 hypothetical protein TTHERM_00390020 [Tetrahymena thermophila SB210]
MQDKAEIMIKNTNINYITTIKNERFRQLQKDEQYNNIFINSQMRQFCSIYFL